MIMLNNLITYRPSLFREDVIYGTLDGVFIFHLVHGYARPGVATLLVPDI